MTSISFGNTNSGYQVGINYGEIQLPPGEFHQACCPARTNRRFLAPERPETPPPPVSTVPFRRDPDFIDRGTLLDQIQEKGSTQGARIALVGLGGVG